MVQNKWNKKFYEVIKRNSGKVLLKRIEDNKEFEITESEFNLSYKEIKK